MQAKPVLDENEETVEYRFDASGANKSLQLLGMHVGAFEADNTQKGDKTINIINFSNIDDTKQIISGSAGPARITGSQSVWPYCKGYSVFRSWMAQAGSQDDYYSKPTRKGMLHVS